MPTEIKPAGLPGERYDFGDIFSALSKGNAAEPDLTSAPAKESIGEQFRRLLGWIESIGGKHNEIPVRRAIEYTGLVVKVEDYFSVQHVGRGECIVIINNRLDRKLLEGSIATVGINEEGYGRVTVQPQLGMGGRAD